MRSEAISNTRLAHRIPVVVTTRTSPPVQQLQGSPASCKADNVRQDDKTWVISMMNQTVRHRSDTHGVGRHVCVVSMRESVGSTSCDRCCKRKKSEGHSCSESPYKCTLAHLLPYKLGYASLIGDNDIGYCLEDLE